MSKNRTGLNQYDAQVAYNATVRNRINAETVLKQMKGIEKFALGALDIARAEHAVHVAKMAYRNP